MSRQRKAAKLNMARSVTSRYSESIWATTTEHDRAPRSAGPCRPTLGKVCRRMRLGLGTSESCKRPGRRGTFLMCPWRLGRTFFMQRTSMRRMWHSGCSLAAGGAGSLSLGVPAVFSFGPGIPRGAMRLRLVCSTALLSRLVPPFGRHSGVRRGRLRSGVRKPRSQASSQGIGTRKWSACQDHIKEEVSGGGRGRRTSKPRAGPAKDKPMTERLTLWLRLQNR